MASFCACGRSDPNRFVEPEFDSDASELVQIATPAALNSGEPRLVVGDDNRMYLSWIQPGGDGGHELRFVIWDGSRWSESRLIAAGSNWFVNWADFPQIAALSDGTLAAHWLAKSADSTYAYDVVMATSSDSGMNWSRPVRPHRDGTPTEHGFVSIVPAPDASFDVIWLDGRQASDTPPGPMTLRHARLCSDGQVSLTTVIDSSVCDCCPTDARRTADGQVVVTYRGRTADEVRDIRVARYDGASWSEPVSVHDDGWVVAGCPVNGPAIDVAGDIVAVAWYTEPSKDQGAVRLAFSSDGGVTFATPLAVDHGRPLGRVDLALLEDHSALVSWLERTDESAAILVRHVAPTGVITPARLATTTHVSRSSGFPQMARFEGQTFVAWTEVSDDGTQVRSAILPPG